MGEEEEEEEGASCEREVVSSVAMSFSISIVLGV